MACKPVDEVQKKRLKKGKSLVGNHSDTRTREQTYVCVGQFTPPTVEYPISPLHEHPGAMIKDRFVAAMYPFSKYAGWDLDG